MLNANVNIIVLRMSNTKIDVGYRREKISQLFITFLGVRMFALAFTQHQPKQKK